MIYCGCKKCGGNADRCFGDTHPGIEFRPITNNAVSPQGGTGFGVDSTTLLDGDYAGTVGPEIHKKLGEELARKATAIEKYADSLCKRIKNGDPIRREEAHTVSCMAFDMGQHIQWHLKHKAI